MALANPLGLLGLLGILPVVALYILRRRPGRETVPSLVLFREVTEEPSYTSFLKRLLRERSLLLQILAIALAAIALAGPYTAADAPGGTAVVIDASASTKPVADELRTAAESHVDGETTVILAASSPIELAASADEGRARDLIGNTEPLDTEADLSAAMRLARDRGAGRVAVVSDFLGWRGRDPGDTAEELESGGVDVALDTVGEPTPNVGFVDGRVAETDGGHTLRLTAARYGGAPGSVAYAASRDGEPLQEGSLQMDPGETAQLALIDLSPGEVTVTLRDAGPGFDDSAYTYVPSDGERVLVVGEGSEAEALRASGADVEVADSADSFAGYGLVVVKSYDSIDLDALESYVRSGGHAALLADPGLDAAPDGLLPVAPGSVTQGSPEIRDHETELTRGVDISKVSLDTYLEAGADPDARVHAETVNGTPVLATRSVGSGEATYVGLRTDWSDAGFRRGYPVLWSNVLEGGSLPSNALTGTRVPLGDSVTVDAPGGSVTTDRLHLDEAGFYRWDGGELAANLFSPTETDTSERLLAADRFAFEPDEGTGEAAAERRTDYTPLVLLALAGVLLYEIRFARVKG